MQDWTSLQILSFAFGDPRSFVLGGRSRQASFDESACTPGLQLSEMMMYQDLVTIAG
jgi:hypothetical protein